MFCLTFHSIFHLHAVLLCISQSFQCFIWGRWTASAAFHFSLFPFSDLFLHFALPSILSFICMLFFCSSANHSSAWFEVDGQEMATGYARPPQGIQLGLSRANKGAGAMFTGTEGRGSDQWTQHTHLTTVLMLLMFFPLYMQHLCTAIAIHRRGLLTAVVVCKVNF